MNPHRMAYGIAYNFDFLDYVGGLTILSALITREPKSLPNHPLIYLLLIYIAWVTLTTTFAVEQATAWTTWMIFIKIYIFTFLTLMFINTKARIHALLWVIMLSIGFFSAKGGFYTLALGGAGRVWGPAGSFIADNNDFGLVSVMLTPIIYYMYGYVTNIHIKRLLLLLGILTIMAVFGTQSRGAFLALTAMLFFLVMKSKRKVLGLMTLVFALAIGFAFMPDSWRTRMDSIQTYQEDASAQGRLTMWKFAIDVANDHPILGGGLDVFYNEPYRAHYLPFGVEGRAVHSIYFEALGQHGYVGLILFLLIFITAYYTCSTIMSRTRDHPELHWYRDLAGMLQVSLVAYAVAGAFLNLGTFDLYYHLIAIITLLRVMSDKQLILKEQTALAAPGAQAAVALP
jgi:probable O-glycosylation ligase (exosortase A-associated)